MGSIIFSVNTLLYKHSVAYYLLFVLALACICFKFNHQLFFLGGAVMQFGGQRPVGRGVPSIGMALPGFVSQQQLGLNNSEMTW